MRPFILLGQVGTRNPALLAALLAYVSSTGLAAPAIGKSFATPQAAVTALAEAVQTTNRAELREIFGPSADDLISPDPVQAANEFATFAAALAQTNYFAPESNTRRVLVVGAQSYPFPIPLVRQNGGWSFDTVAGQEELWNRRIGRNELATLQTVRAYIAAQREYASRERDGSGVLKYAQKLVSTPGKKDGLYWPPELDGEISPLGPLVAEAQQEGYRRKSSAPDAPRQPYHGYYFKLLTRQSRHAPGGKYN